MFPKVEYIGATRRVRGYEFAEAKVPSGNGGFPLISLGEGVVRHTSFVFSEIMGLMRVFGAGR